MEDIHIHKIYSKFLLDMMVMGRDLSPSMYTDEVANLDIFSLDKRKRNSETKLELLARKTRERFKYSWYIVRRYGI